MEEETGKPAPDVDPVADADEAPAKSDFDPDLGTITFVPTPIDQIMGSIPGGPGAVDPRRHVAPPNRHPRRAKNNPKRPARKRGFDEKDDNLRWAIPYSQARAYAIQNPTAGMPDVSKRFRIPIGRLTYWFRCDGTDDIRATFRTKLIEEAASVLSERMGSGAAEQLTQLAADLEATRHALLERIVAAAKVSATDTDRMSDETRMREGLIPGGNPNSPGTSVRTEARYRAPHLDRAILSTVIEAECRVLEIMIGIRKAADLKIHGAMLARAGVSMPQMGNGQETNHAAHQTHGQLPGTFDPDAAGRAAIEAFGIVQGPNGSSMLAPPGGAAS